MNIEKSSTSSDHSSNLFLTGTILLANMDYSGLFDYALKALIGGAIWMSFKLLGDVVSNKLKSKKTD